MQMPFGKHKGTEVDQLPSDYLLWLVSNIDMREQLKEAVIEALEEVHSIIVTPDMFFDTATGKQGSKPKFDNSYFNSFPTYLNPNNDMKELLKKIVDQGYKKVSLKLHPDHGGKKEDMQALTDVKDWLYKGFKL